MDAQVLQLWPWMTVKVIQADIKIYSLVLSIIIPSLKEIGLQMPEYKPTLKGCFLNEIIQVFSLEYWIPETK